ncbi:hypothetical protein [Prescottella sp. R16]|uniref:DUF7507 domain-containing protein n=1 Tax=Prescottella sp. R16 TaxID=3064529 RepID=UPI00272E807A|nr:hypothetical protein [Prescottella sp. R16]
MRRCGAAFRILVVAVLTGVVALVTTPAVLAQPAAAGLSLSKSASPGGVFTAGDTVTYRFVVSNTGGVPIDGIGVDETAFTGSGSAPAVTCPSGTLQPGRSITCTAGYEVTDIDAAVCFVDNTAAATGTDPRQQAVRSAPSSARIVTDCGNDAAGSAEQGSLEDLGLDELLGSAELGSLGAGSAGPEALGSLGAGAVGALGSLGVGAMGSLGAVGALIVGALTTPYQPAALCSTDLLANVPFLNLPCPERPGGPA